MHAEMAVLFVVPTSIERERERERERGEKQISRSKQVGDTVLDLPVTVHAADESEDIQSTTFNSNNQ
jgi:hypothetical protein